jgi:hypothetical protein
MPENERVTCQESELEKYSCGPTKRQKRRCKKNPDIYCCSLCELYGHERCPESTRCNIEGTEV